MMYTPCTDYVEQYRLIIEESNSQISIAQNKQITMKELMERWFLVKSLSYRKNTTQNMLLVLNKHLYPYFESYSITPSNITAEKLEKYYLYKLESGLNPNTVHKHHSYIYSALEWAKDKNLIKENVAEKAILPRHQRFKGRCLEDEEINIYMDIFFQDKIRIPFFLGLFLGLRRSEAIGLKWSDIKGNTITIKRAAVYIIENGKQTLKIVEYLKNDASYRALELSDDILNFLNLEKQIRISNSKKSQYCKKYKNFICVNDTGELIKPDYVSNRFRKVQKKNSIIFPIRFHDLRHTCASILYAQGASDIDVQKWLGHSNITTTANIYVHINKNKSITLANKINDYINNTL